MEYKFSHSLVVMGQLAKEAARTPPSEDHSPFEYVDRSLTVLGRTFNTHSQRMRHEFLGQREFIASQFRDVEKRMDGRFEEVDRRFEEMDKRMRHFFDQVQRASRNFLRIRGWEEISPVGKLDAQGEIHTPEYFPGTVRRFWALKHPSQSELSEAYNKHT